MKTTMFFFKKKKAVELSLVGVFFALSILLLSCASGVIDTPSVPVAPVVSTTDVTNITQNSVTLGGNVSFEGNDLVSERGLCWGQNPNPTVSDNKITNGVGLGSFTGTINGLTPGTSYHARAFARNSVGVSYGLDVPFSTNTIMYPVTITYGANGKASSTLKEVASGGTLPISIIADPGFTPDSVKINGISFPLGRITTYNLTNVIKATTAHFTFKIDLNAIINKGAWKQDSLWIENDDGSWAKNAYEKKDSVFFLPTGRYSIYRDNVLVGDGNWSIIESFKAVPVLNFGGTIWDIERLDPNNLVVIRQVTNLDPKITKKIWVKIIYNRYSSGSK